MSPSDVLEFLCGIWSLHRRVTHNPEFNQASRMDVMTGTVTFNRLSPDCIESYETGQLILDSGQVLTARRQYIYMRDPVGIQIYFKEQPRRLFQTVPLTACQSNDVFDTASIQFEGRACHACPPDHYDSVYRLTRTECGIHHMKITHHVKGPRKQYCMTTDMKQIPQGS